MTRVAVIGLGYWGPNLVRNFHRLLGPDLRVCCDQSAQRTAAIASSYPSIRCVSDAASVFSDPEIDAVAIATPVATHYPLAKAALLAGKSVLVEKPLASSTAESEELVDLVQQQGLVLMVDHVFIHNLAVQRMKETIDQGDLGDLLYIDSVRINLGKFQNDVNVVWDLAPHDLSIVDYLVGRTPRSVAAFGASHTEQGLEDVAYLNLDFGGGLIANFHVNWLSPVKIRYTIVGGREKSIVFNDLHPAELLKIYDSGVDVRTDNLHDRRRVLVDYRTGDIQSPHIPRCEPLQNVVSNFVQSIEEGVAPLTDGSAGLRVVRTLEAAQRSIESGGERVWLEKSDQPSSPAAAIQPDLTGGRWPGSESLPVG